MRLGVPKRLPLISPDCQLVPKRNHKPPPKLFLGIGIDVSGRSTELRNYETTCTNNRSRHGTYIRVSRRPGFGAGPRRWRPGPTSPIVRRLVIGIHQPRTRRTIGKHRKVDWRYLRENSDSGRT